VQYIVFIFSFFGTGRAECFFS